MSQQANQIIEQHEWLPSEESSKEKEFAFSNGYLRQTGHFEEHYSQAQCSSTFIRGVEVPILNISGISVRLHEERLDLSEWEVHDFHRRLHVEDNLLERHFTATSPNGATLQIHSKRQLIADSGLMSLEYEIVSENYTGPISLLAILGGYEDESNWYPLMNHLDTDQCWLWLQVHDIDLQLCCAMRWQVLQNNVLIERRPIKIEKPHTIGYSLTTRIKAGESCVLRKYVAVVDSRAHKKEELIQEAIKCLTSL